MHEFIRLTGVTYDGRQNNIARLSAFDDIYMEREYNNFYDCNAIGVYNSFSESIGWIPRDIAAKIAPRLDSGEKFNIKINKILGGGTLAYGVEVLLTSSEDIDLKEYKDWQRRQEKVLEIINRPQTKEESKIVFEEFNKGLRETRERHILEGNFDELAILLHNGWLKLDSIQSFAEQCFQTGRFEDSYKALLTLKVLAEQYRHDKLLNFCNNNIKIFLSYGYDQPLPVPTIENYPQSIEKADETYPDFDRLLEENDSLLESLYEEAESENPEVQAAAFFTIGELHFLSKHIPETIHFYKEAIRVNPNKALYWGYTAQVLNRNSIHPLVSTRYLRNALVLDPHNPRWHFLQAILLVKISQEEDIEELLVQAVAEINLALELCRPDQKGLRRAILIQMGEYNSSL
ncbi:MAG: HIRAN domain-containing protein [Bacillaceae bacterium]|nr:HIRAN domain-containing protein [Bacillaceae bacterium]